MTTESDESSATPLVSGGEESRLAVFEQHRTLLLVTPDTHAQEPW